MNDEVKDKIVYYSEDENPWVESNNLKAEVSLKSISSPAKDYHLPYFNKIATNINPDSEKYIPSYSSNSSEADLFANLDSEEKVIENQI